MTLSEAQHRAGLVLTTLVAPDLAARARQVILELSMTACGKAANYQPSGGGDQDRGPTSGDPNPPHVILVKRIAGAETEYAVKSAVKWGETELHRIRHQPQAFAVRPESERERHKRIVSTGKGWTIHEVASALSVAPNEVRQARIAAGRDVTLGEPIAGAETAGNLTQTVVTLKRQGLTQKQIAKQLGVSQPTVSRAWKQAA